MRKLLIIILLFLCLSCTTTRYVDKPVYIDKVRTEYINQIYKDSVYVHDSIDRYISGDTVYLYKYKYIYKYLNRTDTVIQNDTIELPVEVKVTEVKEVNKLKWYQTVLMWIGAILSLLYTFKLGRYIGTKFKI